jgi:signal transduction histidine kinase
MGVGRSGLALALAIAAATMWVVNGAPLAGGHGGPVASGSLAFGASLGLVLLAWWAKAARATRELTPCHDLARVFNPHDSLEASLRAFAAMLCSGHRADRSVVVLEDAHSQPARLCVHVADAPPAAARHAGFDAQQVRALFALPSHRAILYRQTARRATARCIGLDVASMALASADGAQVGPLARLFAARSFVSAPLRSRGRTLGWVHLVSQRRCFDRHDLRSLAALVTQAGPLVENMQLVEQLSLSVAEQERRRISRDLHDSTIQPYIGLKLGLEALRRTLPAGTAVAHEVDELIAMAGEGVSQLRQYVGRLNGADERPSRCQPLVQRVRAHAHRFSALYGIETTVAATEEIFVSAPLYEEVIQMVREGLANIRRHTQARRAALALRSAGGTLYIEIRNDPGGAGPVPARFTPRSIGERTRELGGRMTVHERDGDTVVAVEIPL